LVLVLLGIANGHKDDRHDFRLLSLQDGWPAAEIEFNLGPLGCGGAIRGFEFRAGVDVELRLLVDGM
jgi:hypothetical protein